MSSLDSGGAVRISIRELVSQGSTDFVEQVLGTNLVEILMAQHAKGSDDVTESLIDYLRKSVWTRFGSEWDLLNNPQARLAILNWIPRSQRLVIFQMLKDQKVWSDENSSAVLLDPARKWSKRAISILARAFDCEIPSPPEQVVDQLSPVDSCEPNYGLRVYQHKVVSDLLEALNSFEPKAMVHLPTGAGKTRVAVSMLSRFLCQRPLKSRKYVLWVASRQELLKQASSELSACWKSLGDTPLRIVRQWDRLKPDWQQVLSHDEAAVVFISIQSLSILSKLECFKSLCSQTGLLIYDEAHESTADQASKVFELMEVFLPDDYGWVGLSATPARSTLAEMERLVESFGARKISMHTPNGEAPIQYLIDQKYLAVPTYRNYSYVIESASSARDANSISNHDQLLDFISNDAHRNLFILDHIDDAVKSGFKRILVFAPTVSCSHLLHTAAVARGLCSRSVEGKTSSHDRDEAIKWFADTESKDEPRILFNCQLLTAGFDNPLIDACFITRPTNSAVEYSQMVGRALRGEKSGGTKTCLIASVTDDSIDRLSDVSDLFNSWEEYWNAG